MPLVIKQTPWTERNFDFSFPVGLYPIIIERLQGTSPQLRAMLHAVPEEKLELKTAESWSVKEIIGHLYDLESLWNARIDDFMQKKEILTAADMSNSKTKKAAHNEKKLSELLAQFSMAREKLITRVKDCNEAAASATAIHHRLQKPMRLIDSLFFVAEHDDHELSKIRRLLEF